MLFLLPKIGGIVSETKQAAAEIAATVSAAASKTTYVGAGGGFIAWLLSIDILPWLGFAVALGGFIVNLIFKFLENKRAAELHKINMRKMMCRNGECNEVD